MAVKHLVVSVLALNPVAQVVHLKAVSPVTGVFRVVQLSMLAQQTLLFKARLNPVAQASQAPETAVDKVAQLAMVAMQESLLAATVKLVAQVKQVVAVS